MQEIAGMGYQKLRKETPKYEILAMKSDKGGTEIENWVRLRTCRWSVEGLEYDRVE